MDPPFGEVGEHKSRRFRQHAHVKGKRFFFSGSGTRTNDPIRASNRILSARALAGSRSGADSLSAVSAIHHHPRRQILAAMSASSRFDRWLTEVVAGVDLANLKSHDCIWRHRGDLKFMLGKRYLRQGRVDEAYSAFADAERLLEEQKGRLHPHTTACHIRLGDRPGACDDYRQALITIVESGHAAHRAARSISDWLSDACD